jgi:hypothetical protein
MCTFLAWLRGIFMNYHSAHRDYFFFLFIHCTRPYGPSILYQGLGKTFLGDIWLFLSDPSLFLFEFGLLGSTVVGAGTFS